MGCCEDDSVNVKENQSLPVNNEPEKIQKIVTFSKSKTNAEDFDRDDFVQKILELHNEERKKYNSPLLEENPKLSNLADDYAEKLISNSTINTIQPLTYEGNYLGENIIFTNTKNPEKIFNKFLEEIKNYNFNEKKFSKNASHYTQIIWKETTKIGIGFHYNELAENKYCTVLLYYPPGNVLGSFGQNVTK